MDRSGDERGVRMEALRIVCAYPEGSLSSSWFHVYTRVKRKIKRGMFRAQVELLPITELPDDLDVLILPPDLGCADGAATTASERLVGQGMELQDAFDRVLRRLVDEGRLGRGGGSRRAVALHRGFQALGERARSTGGPAGGEVG